MHINVYMCIYVYICVYMYIHIYICQTEPFRPIGLHQCSADEQDGEAYIIQATHMSHACGTSKPCLSALTRD